MSYSDKSLSPPTEPADSGNVLLRCCRRRDPTQVDWERAWFGMEPTFTNQKTLKIWQRASKSEKAELKYFNHRYVLGWNRRRPRRWSASTSGRSVAVSRTCLFDPRPSAKKMSISGA